MKDLSDRDSILNARKQLPFQFPFKFHQSYGKVINGQLGAVQLCYASEITLDCVFEVISHKKDAIYSVQHSYGVTIMGNFKSLWYMSVCI